MEDAEQTPSAEGKPASTQTSKRGFVDLLGQYADACQRAGGTIAPERFLRDQGLKPRKDDGEGYVPIDKPFILG